MEIGIAKVRDVRFGSQTRIRGQDVMARLVQDVSHQAEELHLAEFLFEIGEESLGDELGENGVVPFVGREGLDVCFEGAKAVLGHEALSATTFPADLEGLNGIPRTGDLHSRREMFELTDILLCSVAEAVGEFSAGLHAGIHAGIHPAIHRGIHSGIHSGIHNGIRRDIHCKAPLAHTGGGYRG